MPRTAAASGAVCFLTKPFTLEGLQTIVIDAIANPNELRLAFLEGVLHDLAQNKLPGTESKGAFRFVIGSVLHDIKGEMFALGKVLLRRL